MKKNFTTMIKKYFEENRDEMMLGYIGLSSLSYVGHVRDGLRK